MKYTACRKTPLSHHLGRDVRNDWPLLWEPYAVPPRGCLVIDVTATVGHENIISDSNPPPPPQSFFLFLSNMAWHHRRRFSSSSSSAAAGLQCVVAQCRVQDLVGESRRLGSDALLSLLQALIATVHANLPRHERRQRFVDDGDEGWREMPAEGKGTGTASGGGDVFDWGLQSSGT